MPTSRKAKHGSGKVHKPKPLVYNPVNTRKALTEELWAALKEKLTLAQLVELERQISRMVETAVERAAHDAIDATYQRHWACTIRVLRDRFGWGHERILRLWAASMDYIADIEEGRITPDEMLQTLEAEDRIKLHWNADEDNSKRA